MTRASTAGVHHVGLTVPDIRATRAFFTEVLGFSEVGGKPEYPAVFVSDGVVMLTLWQTKDPAAAKAFDRHQQVGLHHLALRVDDFAALDALFEQLNDLPSVTIEFGPSPFGASGARHLMCRIPGGVRLELVAPAHEGRAP